MKPKQTGQAVRRRCLIRRLIATLGRSPSCADPARGEVATQGITPRCTEIAMRLAVCIGKVGSVAHQAAEQECPGGSEPKRLRRLEIEYQLEMGWLLDRQVGRLGALRA
jgi:hypothetical protein